MFHMNLYHKIHHFEFGNLLYLSAVYPIVQTENVNLFSSLISKAAPSPIFAFGNKVATNKPAPSLDKMHNPQPKDKANVAAIDLIISEANNTSSAVTPPIPGAPPSSPDTFGPLSRDSNTSLSDYSRSSSVATVIDPFAAPTPRHSLSDISQNLSAKPSDDLAIPLSSSTPIQSHTALRPSPLKPAPPISLKRLENVASPLLVATDHGSQNVMPQTSAPSTTSPTKERRKFFGVRSYLDDFYDSQGRRNSLNVNRTKEQMQGEGLSGDNADESSHLFKRSGSANHGKKHKRSRHKSKHQDSRWSDPVYRCFNNPLGWKVCLISGFIVLALGLSLILYGFLEVQRPILIRSQELDDATDINSLESDLQAYVDNKVSAATREEIDKALANKPSLVGILDRQNQEETLSQAYVRDALHKNLLILDKSALRHNRKLNWLKMVGLLLFFSAALLLTLSLLLSAVCLNTSKGSGKKPATLKSYTQTRGAYNQAHSCYGDEGGLIDGLGDDNTSSEYDSVSSGADDSLSSQVTLLSTGSVIRLSSSAQNDAQPLIGSVSGLPIDNHRKEDEACHSSSNEWHGQTAK